MVDVARSLMYETSDLLVTHYIILFVDFLDGLQPKPFSFDLQSSGNYPIATLVTK